MSDDLCFLSATDLRRRIGRKEISPVEVTSAVLARAERLQPELNCFITLCAETALAQAQDAERRIMAGEPLRILDGIPFTVKDIVNTKGVRTTFGAIPYATTFPTMTPSPWRGCARRARSSSARPRRRNSAPNA